jgi:hypothetical protein
VSTESEFAAGDYLEARVDQFSGGDLSVLKQGAASPEMRMTWVAPGPPGP